MRRAFVIVIVLMVASCKLRGSGGALQKLASLVSFEGEIEMGMRSPLGGGGTTTMAVFKIKGDRLRTETPMMSMVSITDAGAKKTWTLDSATHTYTEIDLAALATKSPAPVKSAAKATNTGRHDTIAGYACDVWVVDDPAYTRTELCMGSGVRMIAFGLSGPFSMFAKGDDAWSEVMSHGFPLRIAMFDASGVAMVSIEATRVEKKSLPDSDFQVPPGYTKTPSPFGLPTPSPAGT